MSSIKAYCGGNYKRTHLLREITLDDTPAFNDEASQYSRMNSKRTRQRPQQIGRDTWRQSTTRTAGVDSQQCQQTQIAVDDEIMSKIRLKLKLSKTSTKSNNSRWNPMQKSRKSSTSSNANAREDTSILSDTLSVTTNEWHISQYALSSNT